ncbi:hypothetical protein GCM10010123_17550 [Pilimelia anulata]|uniref:Signal peptidase I n=1 Tax=Pilimelia anulata TaxID=53371 RepID=A0A8J3B4G1_9ACTN|nr:signal peptidase I [Pilimelia anulata]GGJ88453.1 hypothetical protein GCM10010123_17550 [Pilimelia anulata]
MTQPAAARRRPRPPVGAALAVAVGIVLVLAGRAWAAEPLRVESDSMTPTLAVGERVLFDKVTPAWHPPRRGELVVFRSPADGALTLKRVAGVAGDDVEIRDALLYVNDRPVDEPYLDLPSIDGLYYGPVRVPAGAVLVLGDNRGSSIDSRDYGPVRLADVRGRAWRWAP